MRRDRRGGRRDARDAGRRRDGGGERLTRPHAYLPPDRTQTRPRATWRAGRGAWARPCRASGTRGGWPLRAGTGRCGRGATTRAPSAPASRSPGGTSGGSPTGAAQGSGNAPDGGRRQRPPARRGNAAVVTGPYGASLKPPATPGDLYRVLTWNSVPGSRTLNLDGMRTVVAREPIRVDSQMPRVPS